jgi:putative membrane protein
MIERYTDHAANERTYLAWVRTALAFMGFGLLVERFDLFVRSLPGLAGTPVGAGASPYAHAAGLVLILAGVLVLAISSHRYLRFKAFIASGEPRDFRASRSDLALVAIVTVIGLFMSVYVVIQVLG